MGGRIAWQLLCNRWSIQPSPRRRNMPEFVGTAGADEDSSVTKLSCASFTSARAPLQRRSCAARTLAWPARGARSADAAMEWVRGQADRRRCAAAGAASRDCPRRRAAPDRRRRRPCVEVGAVRDDQLLDILSLQGSERAVEPSVEPQSGSGARTAPLRALLRPQLRMP